MTPEQKGSLVFAIEHLARALALDDESGVSGALTQLGASFGDDAVASGRAPLDDATSIDGAAAMIAEIERAMAKVREAVADGRYVEAEGWAGSIKDAAEALDDSVGALAGGERNRTLAEEGET
jgi:hypothetical protein